MLIGGDIENQARGPKRGVLWTFGLQGIVLSVTLFPAEVPFVGSEGKYRVEETPGQGSFPAASPRKQIEEGA